MALCNSWSILLPAVLLVTVSAPNPMHYLNSDTTGKGAEILVYGNPACDVDCRGAERKFFCASNGRTFDSLCRVKRAQCNDQYLNVTEGKCKTSIRCLKERSHSLKVQSLPNGSQKVNIPSCKNDGSYAPTQCNMFFGTCWCVTSLGKMVENSSFRIGTPSSCDGSRRGKKRCSNYAYQAAFALTLRNLITKTSKRRAASSSATELQRDAVNAKHDKMDKNKNGNLNLKELKKLIRPYRAISRSCTKAFIRFCDYDENREISAAEWSLCLGVRPNMRNLEPRKRETRRHGINTTTRINTIQPQKTSPVTAPRNCSELRIERLKENKTNVFIPKCESPRDEYYSPLQCFDNYCFCVMRETGVLIKGTVVNNSRPNCQDFENSTDISLPIPGCPSEVKEKFLRQVQNLLIKEMKRTTAKSLLRDNSNLAQRTSTKERAARWYFDTINTNDKRGLGRRENKRFKKFLSSKKVSKRCLKNFTKHCDRNSDKKTTKQEFIACLEVRRQERSGLKRADRKESIDLLKTTDDPDNL